MAGLDDPGGLLNFDSVNPNSVSFATVRQTLTSQPLSLLECCFQSQQRRWLNGAVSCGISEGGLEQVSGCEANSQGLCCSWLHLRAALLLLLCFPSSALSSLGRWLFRSVFMEHCCPWTFDLCCKQMKDVWFFLYRPCWPGLSWLMRISWFPRWSDGPDNCWEHGLFETGLERDERLHHHLWQSRCWRPSGTCSHSVGRRW